MSSLTLETDVHLYAVRRRLSLAQSLKQASLIAAVFALGAFAQLVKWVSVLVL